MDWADAQRVANAGETRRRDDGQQRELVSVVPEVVGGVARAAVKVKIAAGVARHTVVSREHLRAQPGNVESDGAGCCHDHGLLVFDGRLKGLRGPCRTHGAYFAGVTYPFDHTWKQFVSVCIGVAVACRAVDRRRSSDQVGRHRCTALYFPRDALQPYAGTMALNGRILIVEDDVSVREMLAEYLGTHGYEVTQADGGVVMREAVEKTLPDVVLLDVNLPGDDGFTLARFLRERYDVGIIMVTGSADVADRVAGLEVGADDYVVKPFDLRELRARVKSVIRRMQARPSTPPAAEASGAASSSRVPVAACALDLASHQLFASDGREIPLTGMEFDLLKVFVERPNQVLNRDQLLTLTRNREWEPFDRSIDIRIARVRRKIEADPEHPQAIRTVRGAGYMFVPSRTPNQRVFDSSRRRIPDASRSRVRVTGEFLATRTLYRGLSRNPTRSVAWRSRRSPLDLTRSRTGCVRETCGVVGGEGRNRTSAYSQFYGCSVIRIIKHQVKRYAPRSRLPR